MMFDFEMKCQLIPTKCTNLEIRVYNTENKASFHSLKYTKKTILPNNRMKKVNPLIFTWERLLFTLCIQSIKLTTTIILH